MPTELKSISTKSIAMVGTSAIIIRRKEFAIDRSVFERMKFIVSRVISFTVTCGPLVPPKFMSLVSISIECVVTVLQEGFAEWLKG